MKKILSVALAFVMVLSLSVCAFAADTITSVEQSNTSIQRVDIDVVDGSSTHVYKVVVEWTGVYSYTYTPAGTKWDPETHTYKTEGTAKWSYKDANDESVVLNDDAVMTVTVYNHSDLPVTANLTADNTNLGSVANFNGTISAATDLGVSNENIADNDTEKTPHSAATYTLDITKVPAADTTITLTVTITSGQQS